MKMNPADVQRSAGLQLPGEMYNGGKGKMLTESAKVKQNQLDQTEPRAALVLPSQGYGTGPHLLNFFVARDRSSFLHEGSHLFLEELIHDASLPDSSDQVKTDLQAVKDWFSEHADVARKQILSNCEKDMKEAADNPNDMAAQARASSSREAAHLVESDLDYMQKFAQTLGAGMDPAVRMALMAPLHELFARHGEAYFMEGKAPSPGLQSVFDAFRAWLKSIYQKIAGRGREWLGLSMAAGTKIEISPEVQGVMDRLIATDEQIEIMRQRQCLGTIFKNAGESSMTAAEWKVYTGLVAKDQALARAHVVDRALRGMDKQKSAEWEAKDEEIRPEVEAEINGHKDFQALHYLWTGKKHGAEENGEANRKVYLNRDALVRLVGEKALKDLPYNILRIEGGADPQEIGELFGYRSGSEFTCDLLSLEAQTRDLRMRGIQTDLRQYLIDEAVTERLQAHFGDIMGDGTMPREAMDAVHNDASNQVLAMELRALMGQAYMSRPLLGPAYTKGWPHEIIGNRPVSEIVSLSRYARDEAKAGKAAERAILRGDLKDAIAQKQAQIMNHALYTEAKLANVVLDALTKTAAKYAKKRTIKSMDQSALDQVHSLLERFGLKTPAEDAASRETLSDWVKRQEGMGADVVVPDTLFDPNLASVYKDMTVSQMQDLATAIKSIMHIGREALNITVLGKKMDFRATVEDLCQVAHENVKVSDFPLERDPGVVQGSFMQGLKSKWVNAGGRFVQGLKEL